MEQTIEKIENLKIEELAVTNENQNNINARIHVKDKLIETIENLYVDKELGRFISISRSLVTKRLLQKTFLYCESNNIYSFNKMYEKIIYLKTKNFSKSELETFIIFCDKMIMNNYQDLNLLVKPFALLTKFLASMKQHNKIKLDWKIYFKIFFMLNGHSCYEFSYMKPTQQTELNSIHKFFSICNKHFKLNDQDYAFLKEEALRNFYSGNEGSITYALRLINSFFPKKYLANDGELHKLLYKIMVNKNHLSMMIFSVFTKVIKSGLQVDMVQFIDNFFNILNNYVTKGIYIGLGFPEYKKKKVLKRKEDKTNKSMIQILSSLLFLDKYSQFRQTVDKHFQVLLNLINLQLKENSTKESISFNLNFIKAMLISFKEISFIKIKTQISESDIEKDFRPTESSKNRLLEVLSMQDPIFIKAMFYDENVAVQLLREAQKLSNEYEINQKILDTFFYLYENSENNFSSFIEKFNSYLKVFLNITTFTKNKKEVLNFLISVLKLSVEKLSSVSLAVNSSILSLFSQCYLIVNNLKNSNEYTNSTEFNRFVEFLYESSLNLTKKIILLFEMFSSSNKYKILKLFFLSVSNFVPNEMLEKITDMFVNYAYDNVIEKTNIKFYFSIIDDIKNNSSINKSDKSKKLWNLCYNSLIVEDSDNKIDVSDKEKHYLCNYYPEKNYKIDTFNDKKLKYLKKLLQNISFNEIPLTEDFQRELYTLISVLLSEKDIKYHKIAYSAIENLTANKLTPKLVTEKEDPSYYKIRYPVAEDLSLIIDLFEKFVLPYHTYFNSNIEALNGYLDTQNIVSKKEKKKKAKHWLKSKNLESDILGKLLLLYIRLTHSITCTIHNPFLINNCKVLTDSKISKKFQSLTIIEESNSLLNLYKKLNEMRTLFKETHNHLFSFSNYFDLLKNASVSKYYLKAILFHVYDTSNQKIKNNTQDLKAFKKMLKNISPKEKNILKYFNTIDSFYSHLRLFQGSRNENDQSLVKSIVLLSILFIDTSDKKVATLLPEYLTQSILYHNLGKKEVRKVYNSIYQSYLKTINKIKIESNNLLISDKSKFANIASFYSLLIKNFNMTDPFAKVTIIKNSIELITLLTEKKFNEFSLLHRILGEISKIKNELPKSLYFINKKLETFPFLCGLEKAHEIKSNKKLEKLKRVCQETITKTLEHSNSYCNKLRGEAKTYFRSFYEKLSSNSISPNQMLNYILTINMQLSMIYVLDISQIDDYQLLSLYEECYYKNLLTDTPYIQKRVSLICWGLILRLKNKLSKDFDIKLLNDEEFKKNKHDIILESTDNMLGLSFNNIKFLKMSKWNPKKDLMNLDERMVSNLSIKDNFLKLVESLISLKDVINDQALMKSGGSIFTRIIDNFDSIDMFLRHLQNPNNRTKISNVFFADSLLTQNLFDRWESKMFYHIFRLYNLSDIYNYETIISIFTKFINDTNKDNLVVISVLLHTLSGMLKHDIKNKNYESIRRNIFSVMNYYTNNTNKRIDSDILNYFTFLVENLSAKDFHNVFFDPSSKKFILTDYDTDFTIKFLNIISKNYSLKSPYIFNSENSENLNFIDSIIETYLKDNIKLVKNLHQLQFAVSSLFLMFRFVFYNFENFEYMYDEDRTKVYLEKLLKISQNSEIKEIKQFSSYIVFMYKKFFIFQPDLLINYLLDISKITYLELEDFERHLNFLRQSFQFPCYNINIGEYLKHVEAKLNSLDNLHSRKFFVDLLTNLFSSNLNNYNTPMNYVQSLNCLFRMINNSQYEIKEYIVNNLLTYYIHSLDNETNTNIIETLILKIKNLNDDNEITTGLNNSLSIIFILGAYLKVFDLQIPQPIQNLIVSLKEFNNKIFKNRGSESKLIKNLIADFYNKYKYTYEYTRRRMSNDCQDAINELSRSKSYFL